MERNSGILLSRQEPIFEAQNDEIVGDDRMEVDIEHPPFEPASQQGNRNTFQLLSTRVQATGSNSLPYLDSVNNLPINEAATVSVQPGAERHLISDPRTSDNSEQQTLPRNVENNPTLSLGSEASISDDDDDDDGGGDDDDDDGQEDYDSDPGFLDSMAEDTSSPNKEELVRIQSRGEVSALDHKRWERLVYKAFDDPEFKAVACGRITWTLEGLYGTREAPKKKRILRSPTFSIGGFKWNLKVFPRGNEGTDHLSVYIECGGPEETAATPCDLSSGNKSECASTDAAKSSLGCLTSKAKWEVAAQIGCVMYNPAEPRVFKFDQATHQFESCSSDWGWTRFYGTWMTLHKRHQDQRKPMLQADRLAFTAYVRTIDDPTHALWWKPNENQHWDSIAKTGLMPFEGGEELKHALLAALAPWIHLEPFKKLVMRAGLPKQHQEPFRQRCMLFRALQDVLSSLHSADVKSIDLGDIATLMRWYGDGLSESSDTIELWETLRAALNYEFHGGHGGDLEHPDVLSFVKTVRVKYEPQRPGDSIVQQQVLYKTAQEVVDAISRPDQTIYQEWEGYQGSGPFLPRVLQIELRRQRYDSSAREWKRLTHHVQINDTITINYARYFLFGIIVNKGQLGLGKSYAIVRSSHINSRWARYKSGTVTYLTRKQAIESHEGQGDHAEGQDSVAQVLIYIKEDAISEMLPPGKAESSVGPLCPLQQPELNMVGKHSENLPVIVHFASDFVGYEGFGFVAPQRYKGEEKAKIVFKTQFNSSSTIPDVERYLETLRIDADKRNPPIKCFMISWGKPIWYPPSIKRQQLADLGLMANGTEVHLWARHVGQEQDSLSDFKREPQIPKDMEPKEVFVKVFDPSGPRCTGLLSFVATKEYKLADFIPTGTLPPGQLTIYEERTPSLDLCRSNITLETRISSSKIKDNCIIVLAPEEETTELELSKNRRRLSEAQEYYRRLRHPSHWAYQGTMYRKAYFSGSFINASLKNGLVLGFGTRVSANGDYFVGDLRNGKSHGNGTMYYSGSGDVYVGSWLAEQRSGHGKMTYGKTGNVYEGEWLGGLRHGAGTMIFQQADQQLQRCHICYGAEIDALFYRCGHILACLSCARQCSECPVCRKPVDAVVRFFDMRQCGT